jgi:hypothetical protein
MIDYYERLMSVRNRERYEIKNGMKNYLKYKREGNDVLALKSLWRSQKAEMNLQLLNEILGV